MSRGRLDEGIGYYLRSVKLDPHYAQVREYLGEAYVIKRPCERPLSAAQDQGDWRQQRMREYEDLEKAIAGPPEEDG